MGKVGFWQSVDTGNGGVSIFNVSSSWGISETQIQPGGGLFASVNQVGMNFPSPGDKSLKSFYSDLHVKYLSIVGMHEEDDLTKKRADRFKLKIKVKNPALRRLISGGIAGAISRTAVAPLETIRTHLMVGSGGHTIPEVFCDIIKNEGWQGLYRGNLINVIRVAPSRAIELFVFDTANKHLSPKPGENPKIPLPASLVAGACAGVSSTLCTYPLELVKTRLTIQRNVYKGIVDAFVKICREEGVAELYRGLAPSLIGVIPYAAANYYAYDTLRKTYRKLTNQEKIGNLETLLIGSMAGAISSTLTFPLEVARKHMQVGAVSGREVYRNVVHAIVSILRKEGFKGLYKGLGPSCLKIMPAAGISFMCYEACKNILIDDGDVDA